MILVTGAAGFIGFHVAQRLLGDGHAVHGLDNLNDYYDPELKKARLRLLTGNPGFVFHRTDLADHAAIAGIFEKHRPEHVVDHAGSAPPRGTETPPSVGPPSWLAAFEILRMASLN